MAYWACARTEPQQERAAQHFLQLSGFTSYCPRLRVTRHSHGRRIVSKPALFPSYVFVAVVGGWWRARWCPHVVGLIMNGERPAEISGSIIAEIRSRERGGLVDLPPRLRRGDAVRILHGPFAERLALFDGQTARDRVAVLLSLLGGQRRLVMRAGDVEAV